MTSKKQAARSGRGRKRGGSSVVQTMTGSPGAVQSAGRARAGGRVAAAVEATKPEIISADDLGLLRAAVASEQQAAAQFERAAAVLASARSASDFTKTYLKGKYGCGDLDEIELGDGKVIRRPAPASQRMKAPEKE